MPSIGRSIEPLIYPPGVELGEVDHEMWIRWAYKSRWGCRPWGGQDLNLEPTDYESAALTD